MTSDKGISKPDDGHAEQSGPAAPQSFETWAIQEGLISESHGIRFVNAMCDVASKAWYAALAASPAVPAQSTDIAEIFDRQQAGFERCYEALGITDERERSWSSLVMAIIDLAKSAQSGEPIYQTGWPTPETVWGDVPKDAYDTYTEFGYTRRRIVYAAPQATQSGEAVAIVESWTNGSYHRNYRLKWLKDVPEGTSLYASPQSSPTAVVLGDERHQRGEEN